MPYKPNKSLGQNFLLEQPVSMKMVSALKIKENDSIIEIGAGLGALTVTLADYLPLSSKAYAVEIDERFIGKLGTMFLENSNVKIVFDDFLDWFPGFDVPQNYKVIGSLPFNITSPIIHAIVKKDPQPDICVLLMQKEVAEKVSAKGNDASYISSFVQTFFNVGYLYTVDKSLFDPEPKVHGGIVKLVRKESGLSSNDIEKYEGFLHKAFSHPRKMLNKSFTKEELKKVGIDPKLRPQNISPQKWVEMFETLVTGQ